MKIEITDRRRNELLKRLEVSFRISHEGDGTPTRLKVREQLASKLDVDMDRVYVKRLQTKTGTWITVGEANIYDTVQQALSIEPKHIILRNSPRGESEREEA